MCLSGVHASASRESASFCGSEKVCKLGLTHGSQAHVGIEVGGHAMSGHSHTLLRTQKSSIASILAP